MFLNEISWFSSLDYVNKSQVWSINVSSQSMDQLSSFIVFVWTTEIYWSFYFFLDHLLLSFFHLLLSNFFIINELNMLFLCVFNLLSVKVELDSFWGEFSGCSYSKILLYYCHSWCILAFKFEFFNYFFLLNDWDFEVKIFIVLRMRGERWSVINIQALIDIHIANKFVAGIYNPWILRLPALFQSFWFLYIFSWVWFLLLVWLVLDYKITIRVKPKAVSFRNIPFFKIIG